VTHVGLGQVDLESLGPIPDLGQSGVGARSIPTSRLELSPALGNGLDLVGMSARKTIECPLEDGSLLIDHHPQLTDGSGVGLETISTADDLFVAGHLTFELPVHLTETIGEHRPAFSQSGGAMVEVPSKPSHLYTAIVQVTAAVVHLVLDSLRSNQSGLEGWKPGLHFGEGGLFFFDPTRSHLAIVGQLVLLLDQGGHFGDQTVPGRLQRLAAISRTLGLASRFGSPGHGGLCSLTGLS
jgi:hypothetical protein